jgi:phospholipase C
MSGGIGGGEGEGFDLSVKGQIHGYDTAQAAVNVGANDTIIYADSAQAAGIGYGASAKST